ncbi:MAG TPA: DUF3307 domain-containing protein [Ardenticatenaceae bacterium]|nr:DUF3307 domain-containing protein [Ardenticatenaceae bacterium]
MQALFLAHLLSDFALQFDWMIRAKQRGPQGVAPHIAVVAAMTLLAVAPAFGRWWPAALFVIITHALIDVAKVALDHRAGRFRLPLFYLDQALHALMVVGATLLVAGRLDEELWTIPTRFWTVALGYTLVVFVLGILLRVHLVTDRFESRWLGVGERALVMTLALFVSPFLAVLPPLAHIALWRLSGRKATRGAWIEVALGSLAALVGGLLLRGQVG